MSAHVDGLKMKFVQFKFPLDSPTKYQQSRKVFSKDGVHLTSAGYYRLFRSLREIPILELKASKSSSS